MGRSAPRREDRLDVTRPETWSALDGADVVVDLGDATRVPPDELIAWCLSRGLTVLEATSDGPCVERLHQRFASATSGRLVLGAGIFTGVSNLLARQAARDLGGAVERVTLGIASSPFSGAGAGTVALMLSALRQPVVRYEGGRRIEEVGMTSGRSVDFGAATRSTLRAPFAESFMLRESTGAHDVEVLFSPRPAMLVSSFKAMPRWLGASALGQALFGTYFTVLRRALLRGVTSEVELYAAAEATTSEDLRRAERKLVASDGMRAAAWAIAAMVEALLSGAASASSKVCFIDDVCALDPIVARANALSGDEAMRLLR